VRCLLRYAGKFCYWGLPLPSRFVGRRDAVYKENCHIFGIFFTTWNLWLMNPFLTMLHVDLKEFIIMASHCKFGLTIHFPGSTKLIKKSHKKLISGRSRFLGLYFVSFSHKTGWMIVVTFRLFEGIIRHFVGIRRLVSATSCRKAVLYLDLVSCFSLSLLHKRYQCQIPSVPRKCCFQKFLKYQ